MNYMELDLSQSFPGLFKVKKTNIIKIPFETLNIGQIKHNSKIHVHVCF